MWQANHEQQTRIAKVREWAVAEIPRIWQFETRLGEHHLIPYLKIQSDDEAESARFRETMKGMTQAVNGDQRCLADFFCFPCYCGFPVHYERDTRALHYVQMVVYECLIRYLRENGLDDYAARLLWERMKYMLLHPVEGAELPRQDPVSHSRYHAPTCWMVGDLLDQHASLEECAGEYRALLRGEWCAELPPGERGECRNSYQAETRYIRDLCEKGMAHFRGCGAFAYEDYAQLMDLAPELLSPEHVADSANHGDSGDDRLALFHEDTQRYAWERLCSLTPETAWRLTAFQGIYQRGGRWLEKVCDLVDKGQVPPDALVESYDDLPRALTTFARIRALDPSETEEQLVAGLKRYSEATLWRVLAFAGAGRLAVLKALGQDALINLHGFVFRTAGTDPFGPGEKPCDIPNGESTTAGVIDQESLASALVGVSDDALEAYAKALNQSGWHFKDTLLLVAAFQGKNRASIEKAIARDGQIAWRAYGLLPVRDRGEASGRYRTLKNAWNGCGNYGAERQTNTRAAITAGLANLATRAGYSDPVRMEWDLEAELAKEAVGLGAPQQIGDWEVALTLEGIKPLLLVSKRGKALTSVPAGLKRYAEFTELREAQARMKEQAARFRRSLEQMMIRGEWLAKADLARLGQIPVMQGLFSNLIGIDASERFGFIDAVRGELVDGTDRLSISDHVRVVHVNDLYMHGVLSKWQQAVVRGRLIQPFKQAFRELYLLTAAEQDTCHYSNRFAGHTIDTAKAYRLLQGRGWTSSGESDFYKRFPAEQLRVIWEFPGAGHYFTEHDRLNSDRLIFLRDSRPMPLEQIPPRLFSEVMRDADLVVSVANKGTDDSHSSIEAEAARASVVRTIVGEFGFEGIRFDGHFIEVTGKLADYRIHMGSGSIHVQPGNYLCVVPDRREATEAIYLPFADADAKTSEVISKVLLLQSDHLITDETILGQIRRKAGQQHG